MQNSYPIDSPDSHIVGVRQPYDRQYWQNFDQITSAFPHSLADVLHHWPIYVRRTNMTRFLAHYEIFKLISGLPGSIAEVGISRGISFFTWIKFIELFNSTDTSIKVFGFDNFKGLSDFSPNDGRQSSADDKLAGGWGATGRLKDEFYEILDLINNDGILSKRRGIVYEGDLANCFDKWFDDYPGATLSLLHMDVDLYTPTKLALDSLWDSLVPGGIIIFDEYGLPPWQGETNAWNDFCKERSISLRPRKIHGSFTPSAYFIKE